MSRWVRDNAQLDSVGVVALTRIEGHFLGHRRLSKRLHLHKLLARVTVVKRLPHFFRSNPGEGWLSATPLARACHRRRGPRPGGIAVRRAVCRISSSPGCACEPACKRKAPRTGEIPNHWMGSPNAG